MSTTVNTALHTVTQLALGVAGGALIDSVFPALLPGSASIPGTFDPLMVATEVALETLADALLVAAIYTAMNKEGATPDPANGFVIGLALIESQPMLQEKISSLSQYLKSNVFKFEPSLADVSQATTPPNPNAAMPRGVYF